MKTLRVPFALLLVAFCPASLLSQSCVPPPYVSSLSLNTGINPANNSLLSLGAQDPGWTVVADPFSSTTEPRQAVVLVDAIPQWGTLPGSQWIGAQPNADNGVGDYYFQRCFCLRDRLSQASLQFSIRADNRADVYLNQPLAQIQAGVATPIFHGAGGDFWSNVNPEVLSPPVTQGLYSGKNCLIVKVHNEGSVTGLDFAGTINALGPGGAPGVITQACCLGKQPPQGNLKICKVAGPGVTPGTPFHFTAGGVTLTVPAGPAPGGSCVVGPSFPVGTTVLVTEAIPAADAVSSITVNPPPQLVGTPNLTTGTVTVKIASGFTEVTYTNWMKSHQKTGYLEICKQSPGKGNFTFTVNPGNLGPFVVPAGACSPAIEVPAGTVTITETPVSGSVLTNCSTIPANRQGTCDPSTLTSTVTVAPGGVSAQTVAIFNNGLAGSSNNTHGENPN
jgi:hypothetical protein